MIPGLSGPRRRSARRQSEEARNGRHSHYHNQRSRGSRQQPDEQQHSSFSNCNDTASSSRLLAHNHGDRGPCRTRLPFLIQTRTDSDAHRVALEARGRLDERLRDAALLGRRSSENSLPRLAQHYFNALFSEDDVEAFLSEEESEFEVSLRDWLSGRVPSVRETDWMNDPPSSEASIRGLSKAAVMALPREIYGQRRKSKDCEQQDCSVCLETFTSGQILLCLPCQHKFHQACLTPWLEQHEQCPYCRAQIRKALPKIPENSISAVDASAGENNLLSWLEAFETGMSRPSQAL